LADKTHLDSLLYPDSNQISHIFPLQSAFATALTSERRLRPRPAPQPKPEITAAKNKSNNARNRDGIACPDPHADEKQPDHLPNASKDGRVSSACRDDQHKEAQAKISASQKPLVRITANKREGQRSKISSGPGKVFQARFLKISKKSLKPSEDVAEQTLTSNPQARKLRRPPNASRQKKAARRVLGPENKGSSRVNASKSRPLKRKRSSGTEVEDESAVPRTKFKMAKNSTTKGTALKGSGKVMSR
jgi:hypothetical protein